MTDFPERIGLVTDGLGLFALATVDEADTATHYIRRDLADAAVLAERAACAELADIYIYDALGGSVIRERTTQEGE